MFDEFMGIPAHPLLVHAPVVFIPLLAVLAVAYAFLPLVRPHTRWVLGLLAVATPLAALATKLSGDALFERMDAEGRITPSFYPVLEEHQQLGTTTLYASLGLAVVTLALVYLVRPGTPSVRPVGGPGATRTAGTAVRVLTVAGAAVALYYVYRTGDSGAQAVWSDY